MFSRNEVVNLMMGELWEVCCLPGDPQLSDTAKLRHSRKLMSVAWDKELLLKMGDSQRGEPTGGSPLPKSPL